MTYDDAAEEQGRQVVSLHPARSVGGTRLRLPVVHAVAAAPPGGLPGLRLRRERCDRVRPGCAGRVALAAIRRPSRASSAAAVLAAVLHRRRSRAAVFLSPGAPVAEPDSGADGRHRRVVQCPDPAPARRSAGLRRAGRREPGDPGTVPLGGRVAGPLDGPACRPRRRLGAGRGRDRRGAERGGAGRGDRGGGSELLGPGHHDERGGVGAALSGPIRCSRLAGAVRHPGFPGPQLRRDRADRAADRVVLRCSGPRADPGLRGHRLGSGRRAARRAGGRRRDQSGWLRA